MHLRSKTHSPSTSILILIRKKGTVHINTEAVAAEERCDGKFVLWTNTRMSPEAVYRTYKRLWRVKRTFRKAKSTLEVRPIYHPRDETSSGHIVVSFMALRMAVHLYMQLEKKGVTTFWLDLMRDLKQLQAVCLDPIFREES
ncbi:MAG: hypothetical protein JRH18_21495 [Deltaproteobacteria bacterium]|nr:hypothetical protein [Deltaproteobacteria bacterium]MBW1994876.1 hypothetical protein [Deltaproteobacteria bacterium]MBW2154227.1 hypothetical protein [Deltaproteobacteria bacterium]